MSFGTYQPHLSPLIQTGWLQCRFLSQSRQCQSSDCSVRLNLLPWKWRPQVPIYQTARCHIPAEPNTCIIIR